MPESTEQGYAPEPQDYPRRMGILYEAYIAVLCLMQGWKVKMTRETGDFGADLLLFNPYEPGSDPHYAVQCKYWTQTLPLSVVQEIHSATDYYKADTAVIISNQNVTAPAQEFADALGVLVHQVDSSDWDEELPLPLPLPKPEPPVVEKTKDYSGESRTTLTIIGFVVLLMIVVLIIALSH